MKKIILATVVVIVGVAVWGLYGSKPNPAQNATISSNDQAIFFYSLTCPHCKVVEDFVAQNNVKDKVKYSEAEISQNQGNAQLMVEKFKACGVNDEQQMGVPMLWDNGKCYVGQEDVINYFKDKMNANQ